MKPGILLIMLAALFSCSKDNDENKFSLNTSYEITQGTITVDPSLDSYPLGTNVAISAVAKAGYKFSHWEGITSTEANIHIEMDRDYNIRAVFEKEAGTINTSKNVLMTFDISSNTDETWATLAELYDNNTLDKITGAVIKIGNKTLVEDDFFKGKYTGTTETLTAGEKISISVQYGKEPVKSFEIKVPPTFTSKTALTGAIENGVATISWEKLDCVEYVIYRRLEATNGSEITLTLNSDSPVTGTTYSISVNDIFKSNVQLTPAPKYFTLWVCPANTLRSLNGFSSNSYIQITGKKSNGLTTRPKS
jgi:hypothetical protein